MRPDIGLPEELLSPLYPNIGLAGLNLANPLHASIWEAFSTNMYSDSGPGRYMLVQDYNMFPVRSEGGARGEPAPSGILQRGWFHKHLNLIPAAVVLFYELDWNESRWSEKQLDCGLQLNYLRSGLGNRATKLAVVLIQKNSLPVGEDTLAVERATSLCSACELTSNSLFVLPVLHADHLVGYVIRLQNVFIDTAVHYYLNETKRIKNNKDTLNRPNYQLLQVRHLIKVSFFHEIRKDIPTALKHYNMTYAQLLETKVSNKGQIKILCGFINFKICQLSFRTGAPLDAIAQFDRHIKQFKHYATGPQELDFQHRQWLSNQFQFFGDLFNEAISAGLTALQTKHPGFYYLQAAHYTIERRELAGRFRAGVAEQAACGKHPVTLPQTKYFGEYPWEQSHYSSSGGMTNGAVEPAECVFTMQLQELQVDYSRIIIPLLNKGVGQFKQYKPTRMKRYLMLQMGTEYYLAGDPDKAFSIATCVLGEYRRDRWWGILTAVLDLCLKCAYLIGNVQEYLSICCELISGDMLKESEEKAELQQNLLGISRGVVPLFRDGNDVITARSNDDVIAQLWAKRVTGGQDYVIELTKLASFLSCSASFTSTTVLVDGRISFTLQLRSTANLSVTFSKVEVCWDKKSYDVQAVHSTELEIPPGGCRELGFTMEPGASDAGTVLTLTAVRLYITGVNTVVLQFGDIYPAVRCRIGPRAALTEVGLSYLNPVLVGELQHLALRVANKEDSRISNLLVSVHIKSANHVAEICRPNDRTFASKLDFNLQCLDPGETSESAFIIQCYSVTQLQLSYVLTYSLTVGKSHYLCEARDSLTLSSVAPFTTTTRLMSSRCDNIDTELLTSDRCLIYTEIAVSHDSCIQVQDVRYDINPDFIYDEHPTRKEYMLTKHTKVADCIAIQPKNSSKSITIGRLSVVWRRHASSQEYTTTHSILPVVSVNTLPVYLTNTLPSSGTVFSPLTVSLCLVNVSDYVQEVDLVAEPGDLFMFAGHKHLRSRILPNDKEYLQYTLVPLKSGQLAMPQPTIKLLRYPEVESALITNKLTKSIYVKPKVVSVPTTS